MKLLSSLIIVLIFVGTFNSLNHVHCFFQPKIIDTGSSAVARSEDGLGNYAFDYNENHATGGSFRKEKGGPGIQIGSYGLREADGRMRIVNYVADKNGFRASVNSNEHGTIDLKPLNSHTGNNGGAMFSYSTSTSHVAPALPNFDHAASAPSINNYGVSINHQIPYSNLQPTSSPTFSNHYQHHHSSFGHVPMSYSTSTNHVAPAHPSLPAYPALGPPPPPMPSQSLQPTIRKLAPAQKILTKNYPILSHSSSYGIAEQNFRSSNNLPLLTTNKNYQQQQQQQHQPIISTAPATISAPNGLSIPLSVSIHTLG